MKNNASTSRFERLVARVIYLFNKMPLLFLAFLYLTLIVAEKKMNDYQSNVKEQYINNNHLQVSKLGEGSICVHRNELLVKPTN